MSIERSRKTSDRHQAADEATRKSLRERLKNQVRSLRSLKRRSLLESLETRHLMAGPHLVGIQQNSSQLLADGSILTSSPSEFVFKFDEAVDVSSNDFQGIQLSRLASSAANEQAIALTDFGTNGVLQMEFRSVATGTAGNGLRVNFTSSARPSSIPGISVSSDSRTITIDLSNNSTRFTTVQQVLSALSSNALANNIVTAFSVQGNTSAAIDPSKLVANSLTLRGASTAQLRDNLGAGTGTQVRFVATSPGAVGGGITLKLERVNVGGAMAPLVFVSDTTITVRVNSTPGQESTLGEFVDALNNNPDSARLVTTTLELGSRAMKLGTISSFARTLALSAPTDLTIQPGYVGQGNNPNEIVFRFADPLPSGRYKIDILGTGPFALEDVQGEAYNDGTSTTQLFSVDRAPQVLAVVPEPIITVSGVKQPDIGKIYVYFSNEVLASTYLNRNNYQLIFTGDTLNSNDDVTFTPSADPQYDAATGLMILTFANSLSRFAKPGGGFYTGSARLKIGDTFTVPTSSPSTFTPGSDPGDSLTGAYTVPTNLTPNNAAGTTSVVLTGEIKNGSNVLANYPGTGIAGTRRLREEDEGRADGTSPLDAIQGPADPVDGIQTIRYQFPSTFKGDEPGIPGQDTLKTYFNLISSIQKERVREVLSSYSQYLGVQFVEDDLSDTAFKITVGDLYGADPRTTSAPGGLAVATNKFLNTQLGVSDVADVVVMDFQDFEQSNDDQFGGEFFRGAMLAVGQLLGYGDGTALPGSSTQSTAAVFDRFVGSTLLGNNVDNAEIEIEATGIPGQTPITQVEFRQNPNAATPIPTFVIQGSRLVITLGSSTANNSVNMTSLANLLALQIPNVQITATRGLLATNVSRGTLIGTAAPHLVTLTPSTVQNAFPSVVDVVNGQYLYRPDSTDIDLYRFTVSQQSKVTIETLAERDSQASLLNTQLRLFRLNASTNTLEEIAQNDDYFSNDSLIEISNLPAGTYVLGVSSTGNDKYNPNVPGTGQGGLTEGTYDLRITTAATTAQGLKSTSGRLLDGDADGTEGGIFNFWFVPADPSNVIYVDKSSTSTSPDGSLAKPFKTIASAVQVATSGKTIRVLANGGADGKVETAQDNLSYQIGFANNGTQLADGATLDVPKGVQLLIEAGAILKMRSSRIGVGSTAPLVDASNSSIQVLGTPFLRDSSGFIAVDSTGKAIPGSVYFTSLNDTTVGMGNSSATGVAAKAGDWGGLDLRSDIDFADASRVNLENAGVFLNHIQYANLSFGGGQVRVDGRSVVVSPIELALTRATIINSAISRSADAAVAASPDTFLESRYTEPTYQQNGAFIPTVERSGPEIHGNTLTNNSINGLFVRVRTRTGDVLQPLTVQARFDDTDIVHVMTENLVVRGTAGGPVAPGAAPSSLAIRTTPVIGGGQVAAGTYVYRVSFANANSESLASSSTVEVQLNSAGQIQLSQLPVVPGNSEYTMRKVYRARVTAGTTPTDADFRLVATLNSSDTSFNDRLAVGTLVLPSTDRLTARLDARLKMDPGSIVKFGGSRIDVTMGADLIAEGTTSRPVILTSVNDSRYGGSGSYNTVSSSNASTTSLPVAGDWGGVYVGSGASASIDSAVIAGAGGSTRIEGGFASFNAIEVHQGELRLANSRLEEIADGRGTTQDVDPSRSGRGDNATGGIYVNSAQPVIVNNQFVSVHGPAMSFDVNSFSWKNVEDPGRSTGRSDTGRMVSTGNAGPLLSGNQIDNSAIVSTGTVDSVNGLEVRGGIVATEVVWDDVDIVHVVRDTIEIPNQYIYGGMRLQSDSRGSLVVKFADTTRVLPAQNGSATLERNAGIVAGGTLLSSASQFVDIPDRIGGGLQIVGAADYPVVLTALSDDTIGAGFTPLGVQAVDTDNNGVGQTTLTSGVAVPIPSATLPYSQPYSLQDENGPNGTTIDNDVPAGVFGHFTLNNVGDGGRVLTANATYDDANGATIQGQNLNYLWNTFVDVDIISPVAANHIAPLNLANSTVIRTAAAQSATDPDRVISEGSILFHDVNGNGAIDAGDVTLDWRAETFLFDNRGYAYTTVAFSTSDGRAFNAPRSLGLVSVSYSFQVINTLDMNIGIANNDNLFPVGTPGSADFRAVVLDSVDDVGYSHGGIYQNDGFNQVNATFAGWAAEQNQGFVNLAAFEIQQYSAAGVIAPAADPNVATIPNNTTAYGPGDLSTAFAWSLNGPARNSTVTSFVEVVPSDPRDPRAVTLPNSIPDAGSWTGLIVREAANDRNVSLAAENETRFSNKVDANSVPSQAQYLGELAPNLVSGDENRRLGFTVNGAVLTNEDKDVYSFVGVAGSQVWIDLDRTASSLDSVIELIDANGIVLALSDNSLEESMGTIGRYVNTARLNANAAGSLNQFAVAAGSNPSEFGDDFSTNTKDAGMRITLPGAVGERNLYHIRVRSSSVANSTSEADRIAQLTGTAPYAASFLKGKTSGSYQLQVRLREQDETPGTQIRQSDVRFARNGIEVIGGPLHSPLAGDDYETSGNNDTLANAQPLGLYAVAVDAAAFAGVNATNIGPLSSDRLSKSVGGALSSATDVDWFQFDVNYQNTVNAVNYLATVFDIDYADGFARSDVALYVFNAQGQLILIGGDSNIADDQPTGASGTGANDLSRGSAGTADPFIGVTELSAGTYFVAVANQSQIPQVMNQFTNANSTNPLLRLEPVDSVTRLVEDHVETAGGGTASAPSQGVLFDPAASIVPYTLNDMVLYRLNGGTVGINNPFTGTDFGGIGATGPFFNNFAFYPNGEMFGYSALNPLLNADGDLTYNYYRINSETGASTLIGLSGIETYHVVPGQNGPTVVDSDDGINVQAMTFPDNSLGFFVGNRPFNRQNALSGINQNAYFQNIVYAFSPQTGRATGLGAPNRTTRTIGTVTIDERADGAGTQIRERGYIETGVGATGNPRIGNQLAVRDASTVQADGTSIANIVDGDAFAIQTQPGATPFRLELDSGPVLTFATDAAAGSFPVDGTVFSLTTAAGTQIYELDSGPVLVINAAQVADGATVRLTDSNGVLRIFEFDSNGTRTNASAISVPFVIGSSSAQLATALVAAVNGAGFGATAAATAGQGRVDFIGDSTTTPFTVTGSGLSISGAHGSTDVNIPSANIIRVSESATGVELARAVAAATGGAVSGNVVNFRNVISTNIANLVARGVVTQTGASGVSTGSIAVRYLVTDTAEAVALRIAQVINNTTTIQTQGITATTNGNLVVLQGGVLDGSNNSVDPAFAIGGLPPGGIVRGMAMIGPTLYAVSDAGGLYAVANPRNAVQGNIGVYVSSATDLIGLNFTGLSAGPQALENGRYANMLFGVTAAGDLYAFDTNGRLQPVFAGGADHINIGPGVTDIDFSTLEGNLWHVSDRRGNDPGHGINASDNGTRGASAGNQSFYFGAETTNQDIIANAATSPFAVARQDGQPVRNTYNFPGGAKGAIESNPVSLSGFSAADKPMLYFNYFLETDQVNGLTQAAPDQDAFRVYAITDDGVQHLLTTNNTARGGSAAFDDEFDDPTNSGNPAIATLYNDLIQTDVQQTFDNTNSWRQARVSLAPFAGQSNLRLRVEFNTGASFADGTLGLRTIAGNRLTDGQTITVGGQIFEIDLGPTLTVPSGAEISKYYTRTGASAADKVTVVVGGVTYLLNDGNRTAGANEVNVALQQQGDKVLTQFTAAEVATRLAAAITAAGLPTTNQTFAFSGEPNDELVSAPLIPDVSGNAVFTGNGTLESAGDVDLYRINLPAGATLSVSALASNGSTLSANVRLFDLKGAQLAISTNGAPAVFTTDIAQTIVIGFSSNGNSDYNPYVSGSGTPGAAGDYVATVTVNADFRVIQNGSQLQITGGVNASAGADNLTSVVGSAGTVGLPVVVNAGMSSQDVALRLQRVIANQFSSGILTAYPISDSTITLAGLTVTDAGPFGLNGFASSDLFGNTGSSRAAANAFEGVYVDDFIIGFAERGEMATSSNVDSGFIADPSPNLTSPAQPITRTQVGSYQLEIRDGSEYVNSASDQTFRTFETNQRLGNGLTFQVSPAAEIVDGSTFTLSNGVNAVTFEFDVEGTNTGTADGVTQGRVRVLVPAQSKLGTAVNGKVDDGSSTIARNIINAINSASVRNLLGASAVFSDGIDSVSNNRIDLNGDVQFVGTRSGVVTPPSLSFKVAAAATIEDGETFTLSDGTNSVTFEYDLVTSTVTGLGNGVANGNISILVPAISSLAPNNDGSLTIAQNIVNAINGLATNGQLNLTAAFFGGATTIDTDQVIPGGIAIELTGNAAFIQDINHPRDGILSVQNLATSKRGDTNRDRSDQGIIMIENSQVSFSQNIGISLNYGPSVVAPSKAGSGSGVTAAGTNNNNVREQATVVHYPRNLAELNSQKLIPGVVVQSNVLAYNSITGIQVSGLPNVVNGNTIQTSAADPVPFDRIVNNTVFGGTLQRVESTEAAVFNGMEFSMGTMAFADAVPTGGYTRGQGVSDVYASSDRALGVPDALNKGIEPTDPNVSNVALGTVSLGRGGSLIVQFVDNFLTGSGDSRPDLAIFETGQIESVQVAVSRDNVTYVNVGIASGSSNLIDLDAAGFGLEDRFSFVRLTDLRQGTSNSALPELTSTPSALCPVFLPTAINADAKAFRQGKVLHRLC